MSLHPLLDGRRSIRTYEARPVERSLIDGVLEAGRRAPSAANLQPTRVLVVDQPRDLAVCRAAAYGLKPVSAAPVVLICMADLGADAAIEERVGELQARGALEPMDPTGVRSGTGRPFVLKLGETTAVMNCAVAVAHMELQAQALGLGTCWIHHAEFGELRTHFGIPEALEIVTLLTLGHPAERPGPRPRIETIEWRP